MKFENIKKIKEALEEICQDLQDLKSSFQDEDKIEQYEKMIEKVNLNILMLDYDELLLVIAREKTAKIYGYESWELLNRDFHNLNSISQLISFEDVVNRVESFVGQTKAMDALIDAFDRTESKSRGSFRQRLESKLEEMKKENNS